MTPGFRATVFILLLAPFFLSACKQQPKLAKLPDDAVLLAFGDSLTYGTGASPGHNYPSVLAQLTAHQVINAGIPGEISRNGLARLPALLDEHQPRLLILIHGGNDLLHKIPHRETAGNLKQMLAAAKERQIQVLLLGVPQPSLLLLESAEIYGRLAEEEGVPSDLELLPDILGDNDLKSDLVHPNDTGYRKLAEGIADLLRDRGAL